MHVMVIVNASTESAAGGLRNRRGLWWQVTPTRLPRGTTRDASARTHVATSLLRMQQPDLQTLQRTFEQVAA